jgi:acyl-CoA reductase-like NAD-dependent aldehyde dehydrogenase
MTNPQPHPSDPPTPRQLSYLRDLALGRGQTFAYPQTFEEADRQIKRLRKAKRTSAADRRREDRAVSSEMAERRGDAARFHSHELGGYGSSAHWT